MKPAEILCATSVVSLTCAASFHNFFSLPVSSATIWNALKELSGSPVEMLFRMFVQKSIFTRMLYKKMGFLLLFFSFSFCVKAQTVEEIIAKYISFTGGEERWKAVHSIESEGSYDYGGIAFPFKAYSKATNKYKFIVPFKGKYFEQAFDGKRGWKIDAFKGETKKTLLTGKPAVALANEADVELESPFINYKVKGNKATLEGKDTAAGTTCFKVKLIRKNGDTETYFFNTETFELVKKQAISKNAELENSLLDTYYTDYREVKGIKIPFKSVSKSNGQTVLTITVEKAEINTTIPDAVFKF